MKALKGYLQEVYQAHPMAAIFVLGTHREMTDKRAVDPPDKLVKVCCGVVLCLRAISAFSSYGTFSTFSTFSTFH